MLFYCTKPVCYVVLRLINMSNTGTVKDEEQQFQFGASGVRIITEVIQFESPQGPANDDSPSNVHGSGPACHLSQNSVLHLCLRKLSCSTSCCVPLQVSGQHPNNSH